MARQATLSMECSRQEGRSGLPFPSPGDLPSPGLLHCRQILYGLSHQGRGVATEGRKKNGMHGGPVVGMGGGQTHGKEGTQRVGHIDSLQSER